MADEAASKTMIGAYVRENGDSVLWYRGPVPALPEACACCGVEEGTEPETLALDRVEAEVGYRRCGRCRRHARQSIVFCLLGLAVGLYLVFRIYQMSPELLPELLERRPVKTLLVLVPMAGMAALVVVGLTGGIVMTVLDALTNLVGLGEKPGCGGSWPVTEDSVSVRPEDGEEEEAEEVDVQRSRQLRDDAGAGGYGLVIERRALAEALLAPQGIEWTTLPGAPGGNGVEGG